MRAGHDTAMFWRMPPSFEAFCLNQVKGVSKAQDQPRRHVVVGLLRSPRHHTTSSGPRPASVDAVEQRDLVGRTDGAALGAGAVVAVDVNDQRVVELAYVLDGLDDAADLVVVVGLISGKDIGLPDEQLLLLRRELIPLLENLLRPRRELGSCRNHPEPLLVLKNLLPQLVPAVVEEVHVADLLHPFLGRVMRRVGGAGHVIDEERLARVDLVDIRCM